MKHPNPWSKKLASCTFYTEKYVSSLSWVILNLLKSYQKPNTQLIGLKKKFATDQYSNVSTLFQLEPSQPKQENEIKSHRDTTDKKRTISADKLNNMTS